jgi:hypothetical protein
MSRFTEKTGNPEQDPPRHPVQAAPGKAGNLRDERGRWLSRTH